MRPVVSAYVVKRVPVGEAFGAVDLRLHHAVNLILGGPKLYFAHAHRCIKLAEGPT